MVDKLGEHHLEELPPQINDLVEMLPSDDSVAELKVERKGQWKHGKYMKLD